MLSSCTAFYTTVYYHPLHYNHINAEIKIFLQAEYIHQKPKHSSEAIPELEDEESSGDEDDLIAKLQSSGMPTKR